MAIHPNFPQSPHEILKPEVRWFPADEALRETSMEKLMPPLVSQLRKKVKEFPDSGYVGPTDTSKSLLDWGFKAPHMNEQAGVARTQSKDDCAHSEDREAIIYL